MLELAAGFGLFMLVMGLIWWPEEVGQNVARLVKGYRNELAAKDDDDD